MKMTFGQERRKLNCLIFEEQIFIKIIKSDEKSVEDEQTIKNGENETGNSESNCGDVSDSEDDERTVQRTGRETEQKGETAESEQIGESRNN